jgi:hypothetical protein
MCLAEELKRTGVIIYDGLKKSSELLLMIKILPIPNLIKTPFRF